jgi:hypothetical protein
LASLYWCQAPTWPKDQIFVTVGQLQVCWCGVPSLMRGRVLSFTIVAGPRQRRHSQVRVRVTVILRLAVYRQSVRLGTKPLEDHDQKSFQLNPSSHSPYITSPLTRGWICLAFLSSVRIARMACYWKFYLLHCEQVLCQSRLCSADHAYFTYLMLQRQFSHLNDHKLDHRHSESESELLYDWWFTANQSISSSWRQAPWDSRPVILFSNWTLAVILCNILSDEEGSVVSESCRIHDHILLSQIQDSPNLEGQAPIFISPRHWVPFTSPRTTLRTTVEVFDPASTRDFHC